VLRGQYPGKVVHALLKELAEAEEHARAAQRRLRGPRRKRSLRGGDSGVEFGAIGQWNQRLHLAGGRVVDLAGAAGGSGNSLARDPVRDVAEGSGGRGGGGGRKNGGGHRATTSDALE
jgi:hypothetical protein